MAAAKKSQAKTKPRSPSSLMEGKPAPGFELPDAGGRLTSLADLLKRGNLVLYFYPKDMTPGCTREACGFRDSSIHIRDAGAGVAGISGDPPESHQKFASRNNLDFPLLADTDHAVASLYGVYKMKSLYGRKFMGIERTTFLIDRKGIVRKVFERVKPDRHAAEVVAALKEIQESAD